MNLESLAEYLEQKGYGKRGKDIFAFNMPAAAETGILLMNPLSGTPIDHYLPGYRKGRFEIVVRALSYSDGFNLAQCLSDELTIVAETEMTGMQVKNILPRHDPVVFPNSKGDNLEFSVAFDATYVLN